MSLFEEHDYAVSEDGSRSVICWGGSLIDCYYERDGYFFKAGSALSEDVAMAFLATGDVRNLIGRSVVK